MNNNSKVLHYICKY